jgi:signal transduction histidine kinase
MSNDHPLETLIYQAPNPIVMTDQHHRILSINRAALTLFGVRASVIGQPLGDVLPYPEIIEILRSTIHQRPHEITLPSQNTYSITISHVSNVGSILIFNDITTLKDISHKKSELVSNLSRDLRSPLTTILGYVELLERIGELNEQQQNFVGRIIFSVQSITTLINNLLDLDRIEAGMDTASEFVQMRMIVSYAIDGLRERIRNKSQQLEVFMAEDLPLVLGNPIRLRQLVNHILENAVQYTEERGYIRIDLFAEDEFVLLAISDTGQGILPDEQPYIFEKFYRGSNTLKMVEGSGLGLSIVKTIVEQHNGRIWVESQVGQGSTFTVMLPTYQENTDEN